jgi:hypothetical protein
VHTTWISSIAVDQYALDNISEPLNGVEYSGDCLGVPLAEPRVALSAASLPAGQAGPRSCLAVGFPLQSLTRNAASDSRRPLGQKSHCGAFDNTEAYQPINPRGQEGLSQPSSPNISTPLDQDHVGTTRGALIDFFSAAPLLRPGSSQHPAPLLCKGVCSLDGSTSSRAANRQHPLRGAAGSRDMGSPLRGEPMIAHLADHPNKGQTLVKHLGTFV